MPSLFSPWPFPKQQLASGVPRSLPHWSAAPHSSQVPRGWLEKPSMKSKAQREEHYAVLLASPASVSTSEIKKEVGTPHP